MRLRTEYLDLYYLHAPDGNTPIEESLETMDQLVRVDKVRYPAISNYAAWQAVEMHWISQRNGYKAPHISQPMYTPVARGIEQEYNPLYLDRYWHPAYFEAVDQLKAVAAGAGRTIVDLALNRVLHHTATDCVIVGASTEPQLPHNLEAMGKGSLPPDAVAACDGVWNRLRGITPKYNR